MSEYQKCTVVLVIFNEPNSIDFFLVARTISVYRSRSWNGVEMMRIGRHRWYQIGSFGFVPKRTSLFNKQICFSVYFRYGRVIVKSELLAVLRYFSSFPFKISSTSLARSKIRFVGKAFSEKPFAK